MFACLHSYEDKLSGQCEHALYDAAARLEPAIGAITYVANECRSEFEAQCPGCDQALADVGVK